MKKKSQGGFYFIKELQGDKEIKKLIDHLDSVYDNIYKRTLHLTWDDQRVKETMGIAHLITDLNVRLKRHFNGYIISVE